MHKHAPTRKSRLRACLTCLLVERGFVLHVAEHHLPLDYVDSLRWWIICQMRANMGCPAAVSLYRQGILGGAFSASAVYGQALQK